MKRLTIILLILFFTLRAASASSERPSYVTCHLTGQLGNQLFQIATTLAYAWDYNAIPVFPDLNQSTYLMSYNRDRIFFRLDSSPSPCRFRNTFTEASWNSAIRPPFQRNVKLFGYFCSWAHFNHHRNRLLEVFAPSSSILDYLRAKYPDLIDNPKTVSIHVRTGNAELHAKKFYHFMGLEYYKRAIELFPSDSTFVVFSDRINWCKVHFPSLNKKFIFIDSNDAIQDLFLMSMMKHNIVANSSFSWWGAYLNQNPGKIVVAPYSWHHPSFALFPSEPNQFYFDDWKIIKPDYEEPYPVDMTWYDIRSQSSDN